MPLSKDSNLNQKGSLLIMVVLLTLVLVAGFVGYTVFKNNNSSKYQTGGSNSTASASDQFMQQYGQGCKDHPVEFTSSPMALNQLGFIQPLGMVSDGHVTPIDHLYFKGIDQNSPDNTYPVYMPGEGTVIQIQEMPAQYVGDKKDVKAAAEDHFIVISHSCRYFSIFIHIHKLAPALAAAAGSLKPEESKSVSVDLKAGDMIGYIATSYDWIPVDTQSILSGFIHPDLYTSEPWKIHVFDPFTLFSGELKNQLLSKNLRTVEPRSGKIDYDQPGKLIGNWFRQDSGGYSGLNVHQNSNRSYDGHLSIVPDYLDPNSTLVSIGNWDGSAKQFTVKGKVSPAEVSTSTDIVKYELLEFKYLTPSGSEWSDHVGYTVGLHPSQEANLLGTIAFQVLPGEKLKVEKFPGKTQDQVSGFTQNAQIYDR